MKRCSRCGTVKPVTEFSPNGSKSDGRQPHCKTCRAAYMSAKRAADPAELERSRTYNRAYRRASTKLINLHRDEFDELIATEIAAARHGSCFAGQTENVGTTSLQAPQSTSRGARRAGTTPSPQRFGAPDGDGLPGPVRDTAHVLIDAGGI